MYPDYKTRSRQKTNRRPIQPKLSHDHFSETELANHHHHNQLRKLPGRWFRKLNPKNKILNKGLGIETGNRGFSRKVAW